MRALTTPTVWRAALLRRLLVRRDGGVVAILTGLLMVVLLGFCAFATDVGHWYLVREQTQKAADAAVMAAVVRLPDFDEASATSKVYSGRNGYTDGVDGTTVLTERVPGDSNALTVKVSTTVNNFFTGLFGIRTSEISTSSKAVYLPPLGMGNTGCNTLGYDPDVQGGVPDGCPKQKGRTWLSVSSRRALPQTGDPFQSAVSNPDFRAGGYTFDIKVSAPTPHLTVSVYDPAWVMADESCANAGFTEFSKWLIGGGFDSTRAKGGLDSPYCDGDAIVRPANILNFLLDRMDTNYTLTTPDGRSCSNRAVGYDARNIFTLIPTLFDGGADLTKGFRQWAPLCTVDDAPAGTYKLVVQATPPTFWKTDGMPASNHFSLRATTGTGDNSIISVSAHGAMSVYSNTDPSSAPAGVTTWTLGEVPTAAAGRTIQARFYDLGDCVGSCQLRMSIVDSDGNVATGCRNSGVTKVNSCSYPVPAGDFDGKWQNIDIPIPQGYTCEPSPTKDCSYRVRLSGGQPRDVSTWTAKFSRDGVTLSDVG